MSWRDSRLKVVGLDAIPTFKRVVACFPGPADTERFLWLRRLNRGLDTEQMRVCERTKEPNVVPRVFIIDAAFHHMGGTTLEALQRRVMRYFLLSGCQAGGEAIRGPVEVEEGKVPKNYGEYRFFYSGKPAT